LNEALKKTILQHAAHFTTIRRRIHANPELGFAEFNTAKLVADELEQMGLSPIKHIAGTGVTALIDSGVPGKIVALRAEMDALPIDEQTYEQTSDAEERNKPRDDQTDEQINERKELPYRSTIKGRMHACGHDGHTATLHAVAKTLFEHRTQFCGKVKLIFQPAEEACQLDARAMIEAGVLDNPTVDAIFAYHNHPGFQAGMVLNRFRAALSGNTNVLITIVGKGGHAATPEHNIDPILAGAAIAQTFPVINQQLSSADDPVVMRITEFNSGVSRNVVPDIARLAGTIRTASLAQRERAKQRIHTMAQGIAHAHGASAKIEFIDYVPPTVNTEQETALVFTTARRLFGENNVQIKLHPARASEDFAFYLEKIPGCYFFVGNGVDSPSCHSSAYDFNDKILPVAAELLCHVAMDYLASV